jgi:Fe-S oxidoreductase
LGEDSEQEEPGITEKSMKNPKAEPETIEESNTSGSATEPVAADAGQDLSAMRKVLRETPYKKHLMLMRKGCVHCGLCADACHFYLSTGDTSMIPAVKSEKMAEVLRKHDGIRARFPSLGRTERLETRKREALFKVAFEDCTLCGRCGLNCPMGINIETNMHVARSMLHSLGHFPGGLEGPVHTAIEAGNYLGLSTEDFVESVEWVAEELGEELEIEDFTAPIDKQDAAFLYVPHPLEVRDYPLSLTASIKLLYAAGEDYTFSTHCFDAVNYAYYQGDTQNMVVLFKRILEARERLGAKGIVLSPCGHGYRVLFREGPRFLNKPLDFPAHTMVQLLDRYLESGRLQVQRDTIEGPITYHDPCNIGRMGGIIDEPRRVLNALTSQFVEMEPTGVSSICCGGGGGLGSTTEYAERRLEIGKPKADQIRKTGAKIVATNCFNCMTQIRDLNKTYDLGIESKSIVELLGDSVTL